MTRIPGRHTPAEIAFATYLVLDGVDDPDVRLAHLATYGDRWHLITVRRVVGSDVWWHDGPKSPTLFFDDASAAAALAAHARQRPRWAHRLRLLSAVQEPVVAAFADLRDGLIAQQLRLAPGLVRDGQLTAAGFAALDRAHGAVST